MIWSSGFMRKLQIEFVDVLLALFLSLSAVAEGSGRDSLPFSPAVLLCTAPLVVRRRWPIPVLVIAFAGFVIAGDATNLSALAGGLIAALSVGLDSRHPLIGGLAIFVAAAVISIEFGQGSRTELPIPALLTPFLLIGSAFLAGRAISTARQRASHLERERETAVKAAAEEERRHIARELHDVIAHSVGVMVVQAGAARHVLSAKPEAARESLLAVEASGHEAMAELRRLLGVLNDNGESAPLAPASGLAKLDALVARVRDAGLPVELRMEGEPRPLPPGVDVAAYRIIQEALTNALKYSGGAPTQATVRFSSGAVDIDVVDEGKVHTPSEGMGRGLLGMRQRVALFGGTLEAGPLEQGGYTVNAHLPIDQEE